MLIDIPDCREQIVNTICFDLLDSDSINIADDVPTAMLLCSILSIPNIPTMKNVTIYMSTNTKREASIKHKLLVYVTASVLPLYFN